MCVCVCVCVCQAYLYYLGLCGTSSTISLQISGNPGNKYKISLMNALTLYLGTQAIDYLSNSTTTPSVSVVPKTPHFAVYKQLMLELDTEGIP